jgi:hypothetical protein
LLSSPFITSSTDNTSLAVEDLQYDSISSEQQITSSTTENEVIFQEETERIEITSWFKTVGGEYDEHSNKIDVYRGDIFIVGATESFIDSSFELVDVFVSCFSESDGNLKWFRTIQLSDEGYESAVDVVAYEDRVYITGTEGLAS